MSKEMESQELRELLTGMIDKLEAGELSSEDEIKLNKLLASINKFLPICELEMRSTHQHRIST